MSDSIGHKEQPPKAVKEVLDELLMKGTVAFSMAHLLEETQLKPDAARKQLSRLGPRVARVTKSFYLIVTPEHLPRGGPPPDWWLDDYFAWLKRPYYLALQSAASAHGSSPQSIQVTQVMTDKARPPIELGRIRITFFVKRRIEQTPTQQMTNAFAPTRVSTPAATIFDLVRYAPRIGGVGRALETFRSLLPKIEGPELQNVLETEHETTTSQRLGYLLEKAGATKLANVVEKWLPRKRPLTALESAPEIRPDALLVPRWQILDNSREFIP